MRCLCWQKEKKTLYSLWIPNCIQCYVHAGSCETIDLSQNNLADAEDQLVIIRGAFLV